MQQYTLYFVKLFFLEQISWLIIYKSPVSYLMIANIIAHNNTKTVFLER